MELEKSDNVKKNCRNNNNGGMSASLSLLPVTAADNMILNQLPTEVWEMIFLNLRDTSDILNVCNAVPRWNEILYPTRVNWLFQKVFPLIVPFLSKDEIFQLRRVSKRWCYGVDHFLDNNISHRPMSTRSKYLRPDLCRTLDRALFQNDLLYNQSTYPYMADLLKTAALGLHPNSNPILGRSLLMFQNATSVLPSNTEFLEKFGNFLNFLKIKTVCIAGNDILVRIVKLLCLAPNLKKLEIDIHCDRNYENPITKSVDYVQSDKNIWERIDKLMINCIDQLPNLDTLILHTNELCPLALKNRLLKWTCLSSKHSNNLESLSLNFMPIPTNLEISNLTELTFHAISDTDLKSLTDFTPHLKLRKLSLQISKDVSSAVIMETVNHFTSTITQFSLEIYPHRRGHRSFVEDEKVFGEVGALKLPYLEMCTLSESCPSSFNFICELKSLRYLQLHIKDDSLWRSATNEVLDFYKHFGMALNPYSMSNSMSRPCPKMYESNVWKVFPKLKVLTVHLYRGGYSPIEDHKGLWEFRRNHVQ